MSRIIKTVPKIKFKPFGDWEGVSRALNNLSPKIKAAVVEAQHKVAIKILKKVQGHLIKQDLGWKPLNKKYKAHKATNDVDTRTLLARWTYFKNIKTWHRKNGWDVFIGVKSGVYGRRPNGKKNKLDVATIAAIHEFSQKHRRPLWKPTIQELGNKQGIKKLYIDELEKSLRRKGLSKYLKRLKQI